jgi:hydrogenase maturation protease
MGLWADQVEIETIDGGTSPELCSLLDRKLDKLIILDAVRGNKPPGTLYRLNIDDINLSSSCSFSLHELSLVESVQQLELLGRRPKEIVIIGVEPQIIDWSLGLSLAVKEKLPEMVDLAIREAGVLC